MYVDRGVAFMQRILIGDALKKYREFLVGSRQLVRELDGDEWNLRKLSGISTGDFWTWYKTDTMGYDVHAYLTIDKCINLDR